MSPQAEALFKFSDEYMCSVAANFDFRDMEEGTSPS